MENTKLSVKNLIPVILFTIVPLFSNGQLLQRGKVLEQNSGKKTISNVQIQVTGAAPEISDGVGNFRLNLIRHKPGQMIFVNKIEKKGYSVVNQKMLDEWNFAPEKEFEIIMCLTETLQNNIEKYYNIGSANYKEKFNNLKQKIEKQKAENTISGNEFNIRYKELLSDLKKEMELLDSYSDLFARINLDDLSKVEKKAFSLIDQGKIYEAITLYESQKYLEKFSSQTGIEKEAEKEIETLIPSLKNNADLYMFAGGNENYAKAERIFEAIALSDTSKSERVKPYFEFLANQERFDLLEKWGGISYRNSSNLAEKADIMNSLSLMYKKLRDKDKCRIYLEKGIQLIDEAAAGNENPYYIMLQSVLYTNMANYYFNSNNLNEANRYIRMSIEKGLPVADELGGKYAFGVAASYLQLTSLYISGKQYKESAESGTKCIHYFEKSRSESPVIIDRYILHAYGYMAISNKMLHQDETAAKYRDLFTELAARLSANNPELYREQLQQLSYVLDMYF